MKIQKDVLKGLDDIQDNSIDLIFTSPPYWKGFKYESYFNSYLQYINWCKKWIKKLKFKLKDNGFFLLNISNDTETTIKAYELMNLCIDEGWKLHDTIIWNRYNAQPFNTKRNLTNTQEFIFLFRHHSNDVVINKANMKEKYPNVFYTKNITNIWNIPFKVNKNSTLKKTYKTNWGSSGFPPKLCEVVLDLFSKEGDRVLDCFAGNFILGKIGEDKKREMIGIDKN